ncbi:hypothetical protein VNI00_007697 [Paramarasmius palmivorus]|uniref:Uncharacterized protein n=1 Tax=Paramarasmius palmivorus TaxID=297713 RepID=A0AAW0D3C0_9AGAR
MAASTPEIPSLVPDDFQAELSKILEDVPADQEVLLDNVKESLADALSVKLTSETDPNRLPQLKKLHRVFKGWRKALDDSKSETPHLLLFLLDEEYGQTDDDFFEEASLRGSDRLTLLQFAPLAKAYAFDIHFGDAAYVEVGCPKTKPREKDAQAESKEKKMEVDEDDEDDDATSEQSFEELEEMDYDLDLEDERFEVGNIARLDGIPMKISCGDLSHHGTTFGDKRHRLLVNGDVTDRKPRCELDPYMEPGDILHSLTQTWSSKCLIISASNSDQVKFHPSNEIVGYVCSVMSSSGTDVPSARESEAVKMAMQWLDSSHRSSLWTRLASTLCNSAIRWADGNLFVDILNVCGEFRSTTQIGIETLMAGCRAFDWKIIQDRSILSVDGIFSYVPAVTSDSSNSMRLELIKQMSALATESDKQDIIEWCRIHMDAFVENLTRVRVGDVGAIMSWLESRKDPFRSLRATLMPQLLEIQPEIDFWVALFAQLSDNTGITLDRRTLFSVIQTTLQTVADTAKLSMYQLAPFVDLCFCYDALSASDTLFSRTWEEEFQSPVNRASVYSITVHLIPAIDKLGQKYPHLKEHLKNAFFDRTFKHTLLPKYSNSTSMKENITIASGYLDDPIGSMVEWHDSLVEKYKLEPKGTLTDLRTQIDDLIDLAHSLAERVDSPEHQPLLRSWFLQTLTWFDWTSLQKQNYGRYSLCPVISTLDRCVKLGYPDEIPRILDKCLDTPESNHPNYTKYGLYAVLQGLPKFLERHSTSPTMPTDSCVASCTRFADEAAVRILLRPAGVALKSLCDDMKRNPLVSQTPLQKAIQSRIASIGPISIPDITLGDLKNVGCGCPDCTRLLVPIFTQRREPKIGIPLAGKEEVQKHFEERLELTRKWGVLWNVTWQGKLQITRPSALITLQQSFCHLPYVQETMLMIELLGLQEELYAEYAWIRSVTGISSGQKRALDSDVEGSGVGKRVRIE